MKVNMTNILVLNENKHALMICNNKHGTDRWEFPGGKLKDDEDLETSARREPLEELGITTRLKRVFGDYQTQTPEGHFLCRTYFAEIINGTPTIKEPKIHRAYVWASYQDMLKFRDENTLVPNLVTALPKLKEIVF
jgi:ADP-ribose pyrophosphatase YjhB (NUDIX family)